MRKQARSERRAGHRDHRRRRHRRGTGRGTARSEQGARALRLAPHRRRHATCASRCSKGAPRILAPLPEKVSAAATDLLSERARRASSPTAAWRAIEPDRVDRCRRQRLSGRPLRVGGRHQGAAVPGVARPAGRQGRAARRRRAPAGQGRTQASTPSATAPPASAPDGKLVPPRAQCGAPAGGLPGGRAHAHRARRYARSRTTTSTRTTARWSRSGHTSSVGSLMGSLFKARPGSSRASSRA